MELQNSTEEQEITTKVDKSESENLELTSNIKTSKFSNFKRKFKAFAGTKKGKLVIFLSVFGVLVVTTVATFTIYNLINRQSPDVKVAENIASERISDNYDYIYNTEDNKLVASTIDKVKQLELISGEDKIIDYIISPDKKKIAYSLSRSDYKSRIKSPNVDFTKLDFEPIAFRVFELDLESGVNKLIWETEEYQLGATQQQMYHKKSVIYPDSYVTYENWYWDENNNYVTQPYSYPVSYVEYIDDVERGYIGNYVPWDLDVQLRSKAIKLISFNSEGDSVLLASDYNLIAINTLLNSKLEIDSKDTNNSGYYCTITNGAWVGENINLTYSCYENGYINIYKFKNGVLSFVDFKKDSDTSIQITNLWSDSALIYNYMPYDFGGLYTPKLIKFNLDNLVPKTILELEDMSENPISIQSNDKVFAISKIKNNDYYDDRSYKFYEINNDDSIKELFTLDLPSGIGNIKYSALRGQISYYRTYQASTESIIEYRTIDVNSKEEKELLSIKVRNDSVFYYKPKLVWLDVE